MVVLIYALEYLIQGNREKVLISKERGLEKFIFVFLILGILISTLMYIKVIV